MPAAYALSRFDFPGRGPLSLLILGTQMLPVVAILVPLVVIIRSLGLINTLTALVFTHLALGLPVAVWMLKGYVDAIPRELEEAAMIDGCGRFGALRWVLFPLLRPAIVAAGTFAFVLSWGEFLLALALISKTEVKTLPLALQAVFDPYSFSWGEVMAGGVVIAAPADHPLLHVPQPTRRRPAPPAASKGKSWHGSARALYFTGPRALAHRGGAAARPRRRARCAIEALVSGISAGTELNVFRGLAPQWRKHMDPKTRLFLDGGADWTLAGPLRLRQRRPDHRDRPRGREACAPGELVFAYVAARHRQRRRRPAPWSRSATSPIPRSASSSPTSTPPTTACSMPVPRSDPTSWSSGLGVIGQIVVRLLKRAGVRQHRRRRRHRPAPRSARSRAAPPHVLDPGERQGRRGGPRA